MESVCPLKGNKDGLFCSGWRFAGSFGGGSVLSFPSDHPGAGFGNYEHDGQFDYTVYVKPSTLYGSSIQPEEEQPEESRVFFRDIIDEVRLAFSYKFDSSQLMANITN